MSFILNRVSSVVPIGGVATLTGNSGGAISPTAGNINIVGSGGVLVAGAGSTLTITGDGLGVQTITGDTGGALTGSNITVTGASTGLVFNGAGTTETLAGTLIVGNGGTGVATMTTAYAPVCAGTTATGALQVASTGISTAGYVLTSTGASSLPTFQANTSLSWSVITVNQTAAVNNGYICNKGTTLALALPATAAIGDVIRVTGINTALGWQITQAANQQIFFGTSSTTLGATGTLTSSAIRDSIEMVCVVAGASCVFNVISSIGNPSIV